MDEILIDDRLAESLARIRETDDDDLNDETLDAIINDNEIDLLAFSTFAAELGREDQLAAQELIAAVQRRLGELGSSRGMRGTLPEARIAGRVSGTVKWFNAAKGYGFIEVDEHELDVFVNSGDIKAAGFTDLRIGQHVEFDLLEAADGSLSAQKLESSD